MSFPFLEVSVGTAHSCACDNGRLSPSDRIAGDHCWLTLSPRNSVAIAALSIALIFAVSSTGQAQTYSESVLYAPQSVSDGINLFAPVIQASDGNFYGVATANNSTGSTIFKVTPSGQSALIYTFPTLIDQTRIGLTEGNDGNLYGVLTGGGTNTSDAYGIIFEISLPSGTESTLYTFCTSQQSNGDCVGGGQPDGVLIEGSDGNLYGTTDAGGTNGGGTIFKITPAGTLTTLYNFCSQGGSSCSDGLGPEAGLVQGSDGNFYGTATWGGSSCPDNTSTVPGCGVIYKLTPSGTYSVIYSFTGGSTGAFPDSRLVEGPDGSFYGTTQAAYAGAGQPPTPGIVFKVTTSGTLTPLYSPNANVPEDGLVLGSDGNLYGTDYSGGSGEGSIYQLTPAGVATVVYSFSNYPDGANPDAQPMQGSDGNLYGTTLHGGNSLGNYDSGTVWKLAISPSLQPPVSLTFSSQTVAPGQSVTLNWTVANAYSTTLQQCYSFIQGAPAGAGTWTGLQTGTFNAALNPPYSGSATITPTAVGSYTYALTCGGMESGFATLTVASPAALTIDTSTLPNGTVSTPYSQGVQVSGGIPPYSYTLASGSLPAPLQLNSSTGTIAGTPSTPGASSFAITVKDSESPAASVTAALSITVTAVTPSVSLTTQPNTGLVYGQSITLATTESPVEGIAQGYSWTISEDGSALVAGALSNGNGSYSMMTTPHAGQHTFTATYSSTQSFYPSGISNTVSLTVAKATPTVSGWPTASAITYGQTLVSSTLTGGTASTAGTFAWTTPTTAPGAGATSQSVTFTPADTTDYNTVTGTAPVTVNKATPTVTAWPTASAITVGQALSSSVLSGGSASVPGTFAWMSPSTVPAAGSYSGSIIFTPTNGTDYDAVSGTTTVAVNAVQSFTLSAAPATLSVAQGGSETTTITVTDVGGFSGTVSLVATGLPTSVMASFAAGSSPGTQVLTLTAGASAQVTSSAVTITVTGTSGATTATTSISLNITPQPSFTVGSGGTTSISVAPGATSGNTGTISVAGTNGFSGTINLSCAVATSMTNVSDMPSCSLNPLSVIISGTATQTSTLTVTTTAPTSAKNERKLFWPTDGTALALLLFFTVRRKQRNWLTSASMVFLLILISTVGCGGGGTTGGGGTGTTPGSYTITVTGTSGAISNTVGTINLMIQ